MLYISEKNRIFAIAVVILITISVNFAQTRKNPPKTTTTAIQTKPKTPVASGIDEVAVFEKARSESDIAQKIKALQEFIKNYPKSSENTRAAEIIVSSRAALADEKLSAGDNEAGIKLFKEAVADTPIPVSEQLFVKVLLQFPTNLYARGYQSAALEIAKSIEDKIKGNSKYLLGLGAFYLGIENAVEAKRVANESIVISPTSADGYQMLALANRLDFQLEDAEKAYIRALDLTAASAVSKRGLAEMKRATGKSDEAVELYRQLLEKDSTDNASRNGLILSLFDSKKKGEAEELLTKSIAKNGNNLPLLVGAAYWYAANNDGAKAVEFAQSAIQIEPRYTWARIALARGLLLQNDPVEAEKTLVAAQNYGSFPTLDYELATVRLRMGLFEEAARELRKRFAIGNDGYVQTYIAGRKLLEAESFTELLGLERRASIFAPDSTDSAPEAEQLKHLLTFYQKLSQPAVTDTELDKAAGDFVTGEDKMKTHRELFAASRLLEVKKCLPRVLELMKDATKGVDAALQISRPSNVVLADELISSRNMAFSRGESITVSEVPQQTLSNILRGRIEDISGWTLFNQNRPQDAVVRLKRAISILPEKSTWWRAAYWHLGIALDASDNSKDALDALVKSYNSELQQDKFRRDAIENVYRKLNGNLDGIEKLIGINPFISNTSIAEATPVPIPAEVKKAEPDPTVEPTPRVEPAPTVEPSPTVEPAPTVEPTPTVEPAPTVEPTPTVKPAPTVEPTPKLVATPIVVTPNPKVECVITSQNNLSVINNGGNLGILVSFENEVDLSKVTAESSSPADVIVTIDTYIGKQANRLFFLIKSISTKTGDFVITIKSPCGSKDINVKVR